jgi:hypothetical protein
MKRISLFVGLCFLIASCATYQKLELKPGTRIQMLHIDFQTDPSIPSYISNELNTSLDTFIKKYNSKRNRFIIDRASDSSNTLTIKVQGIQLVTAQQQTAGVLVSLIGFSLPFIMVTSGSKFYFVFWYFPRSSSISEITLSEDINGMQNKTIQRLVSAPGFLKSPEKQVVKHGKFFSKTLEGLMKELEKSR